MLRLEIWNDNYTYHIDDLVKNINTDENLTTDLESSSSLWRVTIPRNNPDILDIIQKEDLQAVLKDVDPEDTQIERKRFFTGWVSTSFSYVIDVHGQQAVQITLEDNGVHLLKKPYTKDESFVLEGKFSSITTGDLGIVQKICDKCGITFVGGVTNNTEVKTVAEAAETCESLLKSVCKEMGYVYLFNENGQLYLKPLSTSSLPSGSTVYDNSIYDSINLNRRARTYRGSRIKWTELDNKNDVLIYRVIEGQGTTHPDCYFSITNGQTLPDPQGGYTYYEASDIKNGSEIFSISNVAPEVHCPSGDGSVDYQTSPNCFIKFGAKSLKMLMTATASGHIDKLEAKASVTYVKNHNVTYGEAKDSSETVSITDNLHEEECRWIHTEAPAKKYANFLAQYDRYCSSEFTFRTDELFALGDIIHLNENLHTGLDAYLMVTRRSRTLTSYNETTRQFGGVWSYTAVSTRAFDYNRTVSKESTSIPPTTSYTETQPDISDIASLQLYTDKSFLVKDLRSTATQTMTIKPAVTGGLTVTLTGASYSDGTSIPRYSDRTHSDIPRIQPVNTGIDPWTFEDGWELICYENKDAESISITGTADTLTNTISISLNDKTEYYKCLGNFADDVSCISYCSQNSIPILKGDFYVINNSSSPANGLTRECYSFTQGTPNFQNMPLNVDNANKFLVSLYEATKNNVDLTTISNPNTVSWFNTIIAAKAVIDNLFSQYITILDTGSIHSSAYSDVGAKVNTNPGFWLGANGQLLCDSGHMTNLSISGNSVFGGDFDCDVIKTADGSISVRGTAQATDISKYQSRQLATAIRSLSLGTGLQPARIQNASGTYQQAVAYVSFLIDEGSHNTEYRVSFFDSAGSQINVTNMFSCTTNRESGPSIHYQQGRGISPPEYYTYSNVSFTIEFTQGANRTLQLTLPGGSSGLASGMIYRDSSGYVRIV